MTLIQQLPAEILANLNRADSAIEAAQHLLDNGFNDFAASRAYYASFYAATALLLKNKLEFSKHSGVIASVHRELIKTGILDKKFGRNLTWLFELRNIGDYGVEVHVPESEARQSILAARG